MSLLFEIKNIKNIRLILKLNLEILLKINYLKMIHDRTECQSLENKHPTQFHTYYRDFVPSACSHSCPILVQLNFSQYNLF